METTAGQKFESVKDTTKENFESVKDTAKDKFDNYMESGAGPRRNTVDQLVSGFQTIVAGAEELLNATKNYSSEEFAAQRVKFQDTVAQAKGKMTDAQDVMTEKAKQYTVVTERYVSEHPWKAVALAASVGIIVGLLISRGNGDGDSRHD